MAARPQQVQLLAPTAKKKQSGGGGGGGGAGGGGGGAGAAVAGVAAVAKKQEEKERIIGSYRTIGKSLGQGTFGKVWLVEDAKKQQFALKEVDLDQDKYGSIAAEVFREPAIQDILKHPNVVELTNVFYDAQTRKLNMVMPLAEESLAKRMDNWNTIRTRNLAEKMARLREKFKCAGHILCGLNYLWARGFSHFDLKPANVLAFDDGSYRIGDYGLALPRSSPLHSTGPKDIVTWPYRAPELWCGYDKFDYKVDIWSYGVILIEIFHAVNPFWKDLNQKTILPFIAQRVGWIPTKKNEPIFPSCYKDPNLRPFPQQTGMDIAKNLLGASDAAAWRAYYGTALFDAIWELISGCLQVEPHLRNATIPFMLTGLMHQSTCLMILPTPPLPAKGKTQVFANFMKGTHFDPYYERLAPETKQLAEHIWQRYAARSLGYLKPPEPLRSHPQSRFTNEQVIAAAVLNLASKAMDDYIAFTRKENPPALQNKINDEELLIDRALNFGLWREALAVQRIRARNL